MTARHVHDDPTTVTIGCLGCIASLRAAEIAAAPIRRCTWFVEYRTHEHGEAHLRFTRDVRVLDGWTGWDVDREHAGLTGEAFVLALPDSVDIDETSCAMETMEVVSVVIGPLVVVDPAANTEQPELWEAL